MNSLDTKAGKKLMPLLQNIFHLLLLTSLFLVLHGSKATAEPLYSKCLQQGNYNSDSNFQANLNSLMSSLSSNGPRTGFFNDTAGEVPDQIYGLAFCRGDVSSPTCSSCLSDSSQDILQACPYAKGAMIWYENCYMHYSIINFFSRLDTSQKVRMVYSQNVSEPEQFDQALRKMLNATSLQAAFNSSAHMFATGGVNVTNLVNIYGLVQCTRDMSSDQCIECLRDSISTLQTCCYGRPKGAVLGSSCILWYDMVLFFESVSVWVPQPPAVAPPPEVLVPQSPMPALSPPSANAPIKGNKKSNSRTVTVIVVPVVLASMLACLVCSHLWRRKTSKTKRWEDIKDTRKSLLLDLATLKDATDNFSDANKLGQGGFGTVYKGTLLDGQEIAVKRLSKGSVQGLEQLRNEVVFVAQLQHKNLVRLLGCCLEEKEKLLVYEYVLNTSLDSFIFDDVKREQLDWEQRYKIIQGIARGLLYLHEDSHEQIIHRDLKASNILLDANMNPKISDFGLARLFTGDHTQSKTSKVVGTYGYMAPEYAIHGSVSPKSDVFSFGVLVLEIVSGRRNNSFYDPKCVVNLLSYTWECWNNGTALKLMDSSLGAHSPSHDVLRCIQIGLLCVQENPSDRPTMSSVILMLNRHKMTLKPPLQPAFLFGNDGTESNMLSEDLYSSGGIHEQSRTKSSMLLSLNEVSITEQYPR